MNYFEEKHPLALLIYYLSVLVPVMFLMDIKIIAAAFFAGIIYKCILNHKFPFGNILFTVGALAVMVVINGLTNHRGTTELFFLNNKAVTLEAVKYGAISGLMLGCSIVWFSCMGQVMTGAKIRTAFSFLPKFGLIISMVMRLIPDYIDRYKMVRRADRINSEASDNKENLLKNISSVFTWALEKSMETADSMEMRGYVKIKAVRITRLTFTDYILIIFSIAVQTAYLSKYGLILLTVLFTIPILHHGKENAKWAAFKLKNRNVKL